MIVFLFTKVRKRHGEEKSSFFDALLTLQIVFWNKVRGGGDLIEERRQSV